MPVHAQTRRLLDLGLQVDADPGPPPTEDAILAVHHEVVPAADLAVLLRRGDKPGFVNVDMPDLAEFVPVPEVTIPNRPLYWLVGIDRGDDLQSWSPEEAGRPTATAPATPGL